MSEAGRCQSRRGRLRCAKRVHAVDRHVGLDPDGARDAATEWWDRTPVPAPAAPAPQNAPAFTGDACAECGSFAMVRTGRCLTCQDCGSSSGGCS